MSLPSRTKCCIVGVLVTHAILLLAIILALVVAMQVYGDVVVQDMPGDMRRLHLEKPPMFCQELTVTATPERENDADFQTRPLFDAWTVSRDKLSDIKTKRVHRNLTGQNRLEGQAKDYYSFYWMANSTVDVQLTVKSSLNSSYWVYFLQGVDAWNAMKTVLLDEHPSKPICVKDSCIMDQLIPKKGGVNVSVAVNITGEYYMVFYTNVTGDNMSKSRGLLDNPSLENDPLRNQNEVVAMTSSLGDDPPIHHNEDALKNAAIASQKPAPLGIIGYQILLDLTVYDTDTPIATFKGTSQSEINVPKADDVILLDFNPDYSADTTSSQLRDFSNVLVSLGCRSRMVTYIAVFGLVALALIIFTVMGTLCIINKKFSDDPSPFDIGSGDYTRLVADT